MESNTVPACSWNHLSILGATTNLGTGADAVDETSTKATKDDRPAGVPPIHKVQRFITIPVNSRGPFLMSNGTSDDTLHARLRVILAYVFVV